LAQDKVQRLRGENNVRQMFTGASSKENKVPRSLKETPFNSPYWCLYEKPGGLQKWLTGDGPGIVTAAVTWLTGKSILSKETGSLWFQKTFPRRLGNKVASDDD